MYLALTDERISPLTCIQGSAVREAINAFNRYHFPPSASVFKIEVKQNLGEDRGKPGDLKCDGFSWSEILSIRPPLRKKSDFCCFLLVCPGLVNANNVHCDMQPDNKHVQFPVMSSCILSSLQRKRHNNFSRQCLHHAPESATSDCRQSDQRNNKKKKVIGRRNRNAEISEKTLY